MILRKGGQIDLVNLLAQFAMQQMGFGPVGEIRMLAASGAPYNYYRDKINSANFHAGTGAIWKAEAAMVTGRNDVLLVTPEAHAWRGDAGATATALTWDKSNTHMLGLDPSDLAGYNRARFSHSGYTMANFMTVSGDCNLFKNLRWMHGAATGGASDVTLMTISGTGNRFENIGFAGPNNATQAAASGYRGVKISGSHTHFKNCMFGSVNDIDRSAANALIQFTTGCGGWNIFENCVFRSRSGGGQATAIFIDDAVTDTVVDYTAVFLNCKFLHQGTALTVGITKAANASRKLFFDSQCTFSGVTNIVTAGQESSVVAGGGNPDGAAAYDSKKLLIARAVATT